MLNTIHVKRHKFPYFPLRTTEKSFLGGFCLAPELRVGNVTISDYPAMYTSKHAQLQLFGIPAADDDQIVIGLPLMQVFKYFLIDGPQEEVVISAEEIFEPDPNTGYERYPLVFQEYPGNHIQLFVTIPVAGEDMTLRLDTGSGGGLKITESVWQRLQERTGPVKLKEGTTHYAVYGRFKCKEAVVRDLRFGERTLRKAGIDIFPGGGMPVGDARDGVIGLAFFEDTEIVIDFERNILWVRNEDAD